MDVESIYEEIDNSKHCLALVEGPNDEKSLSKLGFTNIRQLDKPLYQVVEELQNEKEVLILTDLDTHGKKLYRYFYNELTKKGIHVNNRLRLILFTTPVQQIEGLSTFLERKITHIN
ncbi:hypothetical protein GOV11_04805 [Candidatus Woesearchaeota archaeon]|nr:hypothetical protein [Candidatus Woesearchaeota archaeon]